MTDAQKECFYRCALIATLAFHILHALSVPLLVTYDGAEYLRLSRLFWTERFSADWDFARPPIYPLLLRLSCDVLGRQPLGVMMPNIVLGFLGIWALASAVRRIGLPHLAGVTALFLALYPTFVTYEHAVLTEASTFFWLALLTRLLVWQPHCAVVKTVALTAALCGSFYHRPTLLYLTPVVAVVHGGPMLGKAWRERKAGNTAAYGLICAAAVHFTMIALLPFLVASPWNRALEVSPRKDFAKSVLLYGLLKQAVVPPGDTLLGAMSPAYEHAIGASLTQDGRLDVGGLTLASHWPVYVSVAAAHDPAGDRIFHSAVRAHPRRYMQGVVRTLLLYSGLPSIDSENRSYVHGIITNAATGSKLYLPPERLTEVADLITQQTEFLLVPRMLNRTIGPYALCVLLGMCVSLAGFAVGCWRTDGRLLALTTILLAYVAMHSLILLASDRHAVPIYPIALANLLVCPALMFRRTEAQDDEPGSEPSEAEQQ